MAVEREASKWGSDLPWIQAPRAHKASSLTWEDTLSASRPSGAWGASLLFRCHEIGIFSFRYKKNPGWEQLRSKICTPNTKLNQKQKRTAILRPFVPPLVALPVRREKCRNRGASPTRPPHSRGSAGLAAGATPVPRVIFPHPPFNPWHQC